MRTALCDTFGIDYPIFAFTPSGHVAAAVSRAGGLGVLGCVRFNDTEELERVLTWLDDNTEGKPYGVDIVMPMKIPTEGFAAADGITKPVSDKAGVGYETITAMKGVEQLDLLDAANSIVLARSDAGVLNLNVVALP